MSNVSTVLSQVVEHSGQLTAWALAVFGGTVLAVVSTSYRRPSTLLWRLPYLLFIPGWLCIAYSLLRGNQLIGHYLASLMVDQTNLKPISLQVNNSYDDQRSFLLYGLAAFAGWLTVYLLTWVFHTNLYEEKK